MQKSVVKKQDTKRGVTYNFTLMILSLYLINIAIILVMIAPGGAWAADTTLKTQIGFGNTISAGTEIKNLTINTYFLAFYNYAMGLIGVLSAVVIMCGGFIWITAGGNQTRVSTAQSWIGAALSGLILALSAVVILNIVNPELTKETVLEVKKVELKGVEEQKKVEVLVGTSYSRWCCVNKQATAMVGDETCPNGSITKTAAECNEITEGVCMNQGNGAVINQNGSIGWCWESSWNACKATGVSCSNSIMANYECCNGGCLSDGVLSGNSCN